MKKEKTIKKNGQKKVFTQKQENFCKKYIECGVAIEAYKQTYGVANQKLATLERNVSFLMKKPLIIERIKELQALHQERHNLTVDQILAELEEARALSMKMIKPAAAVAAIMGKAKVAGLLIDKVEEVNKKPSLIITANSTPEEAARIYKEELENMR